MATKRFDVVKSKIFNVHSIRSVIIAMLKTKQIKTPETCEYKIDAGSDGNLMPIRLYKMLFLHTNITELKKYIDKEIVLYTYNSSCIPQMGVCRIIIINNSINVISI